jgi:hypothetical protein
MMAINMQSMISMLEKFSQAFYSDDFQSLFVLDDEIQRVLKKTPNVFNLINSNQEYRKYHEDAMFYEESLGHIFSSEWDLVSESNDIKVESHYSGADFYTKASVLIGSNIMKTLAVLNEVDLLSSW